MSDSIHEIRALEVMLDDARDATERAHLHVRELTAENKRLKVALADALMVRVRADEEC